MNKEISSKRKWIFRIIALIIVLIVAVIMFIVGRGHTIYFDNKSIDYNGSTLKAFDKVEVKVKGEQVAKLRERDRGMYDTMGQSFDMDLIITEGDGSTKAVHVGMGLPYSIDGIVLNLPALLAGAPEDVYMSEFVSQAVESEAEDEEPVTDEFGITMEEEPTVDEG